MNVTSMCRKSLHDRLGITKDPVPRERLQVEIATMVAKLEEVADLARPRLIMGVLIRDVQPNSDDLAASRYLLSGNCPANTLVELLAIYLPSESIESLSKKVMTSDKGGDA